MQRRLCSGPLLQHPSFCVLSERGCAMTPDQARPICPPSSSAWHATSEPNRQPLLAEADAAKAARCQRFARRSEGSAVQVCGAIASCGRAGFHRFNIGPDRAANIGLRAKSRGRVEGFSGCWACLLMLVSGRKITQSCAGRVIFRPIGGRRPAKLALLAGSLAHRGWCRCPGCKGPKRPFCPDRIAAQ